MNLISTVQGNKKSFYMTTTAIVTWCKIQYVVVKDWKIRSRHRPKVWYSFMNIIKKRLPTVQNIEQGTL
jgi:hypothetical protein